MWLLVAGLTLGHLEPLGARAPFVAGQGGGIVGGSTSWGLVVVDDDGGARRVCEESTGAPASLHLPVGDGARILAIAGGQLLATLDDGCSWQGVAGPAGAEFRDLDVDRDGVVWAAAGSAGHPSGLLRSDDGGQTFLPTPFWSGPSPLFDVATGADGAGPVVWASGHDIDLEGPFAVVARGPRGDDVAVFGGDLSRYTSVRVVAVDAVGRGLAVGVLTSGASEILALGPAADGPVVVLGEVPLPATHIVAVGGDATDDATDLFVVVTPGQLWHREGGAFVAVEGVRARCAVAAVDGSLWLCGHTTGVLAGVHFARTSDGGQTFEIALRDDEVTERRCPADTVGGAVCARYLEEPAPTDPDDVTDPPDPPAETPADPPIGSTPVDGTDGDVTPTNPVGCAGGASPVAVALVGLCCRRRRPWRQRQPHLRIP